MAENPYWPYVRLAACANGWLVRQDYVDFVGSQAKVVSPDEAYVFNDWNECEKFLETVTTPKRPSAGVSQDG